MCPFAEYVLVCTESTDLLVRHLEKCQDCLTVREYGEMLLLFPATRLPCCPEKEVFLQLAELPAEVAEAVNLHTLLCGHCFRYTLELGRRGAQGLDLELLLGIIDQGRVVHLR